MNTAHAHAFLSPSFAHVWARCAMSAGLAALFPQLSESNDTREGTATHWYAHELYLGFQPENVAPNGVIITDEMVDAAEMYVDDIRARYAEHIRYVTSAAPEFKIAIPGIHPEHCFGTPDFYLYAPAEQLLIIWDLKFGHRFVDAFEFLQGICYYTGLVDLLDANENLLTVEFRIVQPRCWSAYGPVRHWRVRASELRALVNMLKYAAESTLDQNPVATTGDHCSDCNGRFACSAARNSAMSAVDYSKRGLPENPTVAAISFELSTLAAAERAIKARLSGLEAMATSMLKSGTRIPGYGLQDVTGNKRWRDDATPDQIRQLGQALGITIEKPDQFITPTQAIAEAYRCDKSIPKPVIEKTITQFTDRPRSGVKLAVQDQSAILKILQVNKI